MCHHLSLAFRNSMNSWGTQVSHVQLWMKFCEMHKLTVITGASLVPRLLPIQGRHGHPNSMRTAEIGFDTYLYFQQVIIIRHWLSSLQRAWASAPVWNPAIILQSMKTFSTSIVQGVTTVSSWLKFLLLCWRPSDLCLDCCQAVSSVPFPSVPRCCSSEWEPCSGIVPRMFSVAWNEANFVPAWCWTRMVCRCTVFQCTCIVSVTGQSAS